MPGDTTWLFNLNQNLFLTWTKVILDVKAKSHRLRLRYAALVCSSHDFKPHQESLPASCLCAFKYVNMFPSLSLYISKQKGSIYELTHCWFWSFYGIYSWYGNNRINPVVQQKKYCVLEDLNWIHRIKRRTFTGSLQYVYIVIIIISDWLLRKRSKQLQDQICSWSCR